jgi:hypothetical protein
VFFAQIVEASSRRLISPSDAQSVVCSATSLPRTLHSKTG